MQMLLVVIWLLPVLMVFILLKFLLVFIHLFVISRVGEGIPVTGVVVTANTTTSGKNCIQAAPITITVNVTDGTNAIPNAGVEVRDSNGRGNFISTSTTTGANAAYTVVVPPGTYTVRAGHPAYGSLGTTTAVSTTQTITYNVGSTSNYMQ